MGLRDQKYYKNGHDEETRKSAKKQCVAKQRSWKGIHWFKKSNFSNIRNIKKQNYENCQRMS